MARTIQALREEGGESRRQLAEAMGVTLQDLTDWEMERAEPPFSRIRALVEHFDINERQLKLQRPAPSAESG